jgi:hypothetical protein
VKRAVAIAFGIVCCATAAHAYTAAERQYCWPEVKRLCSVGQIAEAALGHYGGVEACFRQHRREISRACIDAIRNAYGRK